MRTSQSFSDSEDEEIDGIIPFLGRVDEPSMVVEPDQRIEHSDEGDNTAFDSLQPSPNNLPVCVTQNGTLLNSIKMFVPGTPEQ